MKKIIASLILSLIFISFSFFYPSEDKKELPEQVTVKPTSIEKGKASTVKETASNPKEKRNVSQVMVVRNKDSEQDKPQTNNFRINRVKEVIEENALAIEETKLVPMEKASERQTRLSLIRTSFKYPLIILEEKGDLRNPKAEVVDSAHAQVAGHFIVRFLPFFEKEMLEERLNEMGCELGTAIGEDSYLVKIKGETTIDLHFNKKEAVGNLTDFIEEVQKRWTVLA